MNFEVVVGLEFWVRGLGLRVGDWTLGPKCKGLIGFYYYYYGMNALGPKHPKILELGPLGHYPNPTSIVAF